MNTYLKAYIVENLAPFTSTSNCINLIEDDLIEIDDNLYVVNQVNKLIEAYEDETNRDLSIQEHVSFSRVSAGEVFNV